MKKINSWLLLVFLQCLLVAGVFSPAIGAAVEDIRADTARAAGGDTALLEVEATLQPGWHVNAHQPEAEYLIPTNVEITDTTVRVIQTDYPPGQPYRSMDGAEPVKIYKDKFSLGIVAQLPEGLEEGLQPLEGQLNYQPCEGERCDPPQSISFSIPLVVESSADSQNSSNTQGYGAGVSSNILANLEGGASIFTLASLFLLGLLMNLTPCVYPLIPVTVAFFGGKQTKKTTVRLLDGALFFLGLVIFYSILGTAAGYTGGLMSRLFQFSAVRLSLSGFMVLLAGSSFGFYRFRIPGIQKFISPGKAGRVSSFFMGLTLGLAAVPCVGPVVAALLAFVGQQGGILVGFLYFILFAAGFGLPYFLLALFTPLLEFLPGSGGWLDWVEKFIGFLLLGMAIFFSASLLPGIILRVLIYGWLAGGLLYLSIAHLPENKILAGLRGLGLIVLAAGVLFAVNWWFFQEPAIKWQPAPSYLENKTKAKKPALFYVTADWCLPCRKMEANTFSQKRIQDYTSAIDFVKADVTTQPPPTVYRWLKDRGIHGVPTVLFLNCDENVLDENRISGYIPPGKLQSKLKHAADNC
ncbi:MAG: protein-disulfide reductase DsbD family protein [bacterium]